MAPPTPRARSALILTALLAVPALLAGCTNLEDLSPVGDAEAGHAGFQCPRGEFVTGFDANGAPRCTSLAALTAPPGQVDCALNKYPYEDLVTGTIMCLTYREFLTRMAREYSSETMNEEWWGRGTIVDDYDYENGGYDPTPYNPSSQSPATGGPARIANGTVTSEAIANGSVTADKIPPGAITLDKLADIAYFQPRLTGTCTGHTYIQSVLSNGNIVCGEPPISATAYDPQATVLIGNGGQTTTYNIPSTAGTIALLQADQTWTGNNVWTENNTWTGLSNISGGIQLAYAKRSNGATPGTYHMQPNEPVVILELVWSRETPIVRLPCLDPDDPSNNGRVYILSIWRWANPEVKIIPCAGHIGHLSDEYKLNPADGHAITLMYTPLQGRTQRGAWFILGR